ncbi:hypothetical protein BJF90_29380 [Pseudonocardia sp. CNS-004]|nr:hypothetical protein BJF90_29380 [Pseudonocardia sp. CNS-004]
MPRWPMLSGMGTDPYAALAAELNFMGRRLDALGAELMRLRAADRAGVPGTEGFPGAPGWAAPAPVAHGWPGPWGTGGPAQAPADPGGGPRAATTARAGARPRLSAPRCSPGPAAA